MSRQLIRDEKFTNIQKAQAGLTKLFEQARAEGAFYRVMRNDKPLGVLVPNEVWDDLLEDMEMYSSENFRKRIAESRADKVSYSAEEIKKKYGLD